MENMKTMTDKYWWDDNVHVPGGTGLYYCQTQQIGILVPGCPGHKEKPDYHCGTKPTAPAGSWRQK